MLRVQSLALGLSMCAVMGGCSQGNEPITESSATESSAMESSEANAGTPNSSAPTPPTSAESTASNSANPPVPNPTPVVPADPTPVAPGSGLSGEWDVIFSSPTGRTKTLKVTLSPTLLEMTGDLDDALVITNGSTFDVALEDEKVDGTRTADSPMQLGAMPLPLDGTIHFAEADSPQNGCGSVLTDSAFSFTCSGDVGGGFNNSKTTATKSQSLVSAFGDVGGVWSVTSGNAQCTATLEGSTIEVTCEGGGANGSITITLDGDRVTGLTSGGAEFTAQRR